MNLPQIRLEPVLRARAEELSPGPVRFGHELTRLEQDDDGVDRHRPRSTPPAAEYVVRCRVPARRDGGRRSAGLVGVDYEGLRRRSAAPQRIHVTADFSPWLRDDGRADPLDLLTAGRRARW